MNNLELLTPSAQSAAHHARRLLLLSFHFPPGQATGALRWQQLSRFAAERGWQIDVITRHPAELSSSDPSRLAQLPPQVRVFGVRSDVGRIVGWEQRALRVIRRLRASRQAAETVVSPGASPASAVPGAPDLVWRDELRYSASPSGLRRAYHAWRFFEEERSWSRAAQQAAGKLFDGHHLIASCGPPHMPHLAACKVARAAGVPFLMDMRDPWSLAPAVTSAMASPLWYRMAESFESTAVRSAALIVANTGRHAAELRRLYPQAAERIIAVMNGCDDDAVPPEPCDRFTVSYAGNIYIDRDPRILFRAVARVIRDEQIAPAAFRLELIGHVDQFGGASVRELAGAEGLLDYLTIHPRLPRGEALRLMARASVLVSLPQDVDLAIPSKVFEYSQFPAWLLALAAPGSATADVLAGSGADVVNPNDEDAIVRALRLRWREFQATGRPAPINTDGRFSRSRQAQIMFDAIDRIVPATGKAAERAA
jgi:glycosyltransferase involved in cell wall biosynthesis